MANFYLAFSRNLPIIPILNKIDLKNANPERVIEQLNGLFEIKGSDVLRISAKMGIGIQDVLEAVVHKIPSPKSITFIYLLLATFEILMKIFRRI